MARKHGLRHVGKATEEARINELGLKSSKAGRNGKNHNGNGHNGAAAKGTRGNSGRKQQAKTFVERNPSNGHSIPDSATMNAYESMGVGGVMTDTAGVAKHVEEAQNPNIGSSDPAAIKRRIAQEAKDFLAIEPSATAADLTGLFAKDMALLGPNGSQIVKDIVHTAFNGEKSLRTARTAKPQNDEDEKDPFGDVKTDTFEVGTKKEENPTSRTDTVKGGGETDMSATETAFKEYLDRHNIGGAGGKKGDSSAKKETPFGADYSGYKIEEANQNATPRVSVKQTMLGGVSETAFSIAAGFGTKALLAKMGIAAMVATFPVSAPIVIGGLVAASTTVIVYGLTGKLTWKKLATTVALGALGGGAAAQFGHMISNSALAQRVTAGITGGATAATVSAAWMLTKEGRQLSMAQKAMRMVTAVAIGFAAGACAGEITEIKDKVGDFLHDLVPTGNHQTTTSALPAAVEPAPVVEHGKAQTLMPDRVHDNMNHDRVTIVPEDASPKHHEPAATEQASAKTARAPARHSHHHHHASHVATTPKVETAVMSSETASTTVAHTDAHPQQDVSHIGESRIEKVGKWERVVVTGHDGQEFKGPLRAAGIQSELEAQRVKFHQQDHFGDDYQKSPYSEKPNPIRNVGKSVVNLFKLGR